MGTVQPQRKASRFRIITLIALLIIAAGFLPLSDELWSQLRWTNRADSIRVLFIGNSFTFVHDMPGLVQELTVSREDLPLIITAQEVFPNATLEGHWKNKKAVKRIHSSQWDFVVLQEQSFRPLLDPQRIKKYAVLFDREIRKSGAKTLLFLTWADQNRPRDQERLRRTYSSLAEDLGAQMVPVGLAWKGAYARNPRIVLHAPDKHHPNATGAYLTACVFTAAISGSTPLGLSHRVARRPKYFWQALAPSIILNIDPVAAKFLQQVAAESTKQ